jgi:transcriptional regulator with GAF, ATPase, and Fis domain
MTETITDKNSEVRLRSLQVQVIAGPGEQQEGVRLDPGGILKIGRDPATSDVWIDSPKVSKTHCVISSEQNGPWILEDTSSNGTRINNVRIKQAIIDQAVTIQISTSVIRLAPVDDVYRAEKINIPKRFTGASNSLRAMCKQIDRVTQSKRKYDISVIVYGETGTGKELVAEELHERYEALGREGPLVTLDCTTLPIHGAESELFGHEPGAYTDARTQRIGRIEAANGGTLFIDEIGDLPLPLQAKLLRALEQRRIRRFGGDVEIDVDVRVVAATNRDLWAMVQTGEFRRDLFHRLCGAVINVPTLAARSDDVATLAVEFLAECGSKTFSPDALEALQKEEWPGNIRELKSVVRAAALSSHKVVDLEAITSAWRRQAFQSGKVQLDRMLAVDWDTAKKRFGDIYWSALYELMDGSIAEMIKLARVSERTARTKVREHVMVGHRDGKREDDGE